MTSMLQEKLENNVHTSSWLIFARVHSRTESGKFEMELVNSCGSLITGIFINISLQLSKSNCGAGVLMEGTEGFGAIYKTI
jgi:hypothetical protein